MCVPIHNIYTSTVLLYEGDNIKKEISPLEKKKSEVA